VTALFQPSMLTGPSGPPAMGFNATITRTTWASLTGTSHTVSHTVDANTDMLIVNTQAFWTGQPGGRISGVTWNGVAMTEDNFYWTTIGGGTSSDNTIFSLLNPDVGTFNLVISLSPTNAHLFGCNAYNATGINKVKNWNSVGTPGSSATVITLPAQTVSAACMTFIAASLVTGAGTPTASGWTSPLVEDFDQGVGTRAFATAQCIEVSGISSKAYSVTSSIVFNSTHGSLMSAEYVWE
jgi:hypothetical protein